MTWGEQLNRLSRGERGQSLPLIVVMMVVLLGFVGLTIDVGHGLLQKRRLQAAVDLGLISGARDLPNTTKARQLAENMTDQNFALVSNQDVNASTSTGCMASGCTNHDRIALTATTTTPTFFVRLFGIDEWTVKASGAACGPCDSSPVKFDVVVVIDRSYSMCLDERSRYNCYDLEQAKAGVRELLNFFDPTVDRISLAALGPSDTNACPRNSTNCRSSSSEGAPFSHATPGPGYNWKTNATSGVCDSADPSHPNVRNRGRFYRSAGDFMDGTTSNHDAWVLVPLSVGTNFKHPDGSINTSSNFVSTLNCMQHKYWTPIAPAIDEARQELVNNGRDDAMKVIVFLGDGGATAQPMRRDDNGNATSSYSWYTPTSGNNNRPCHDAVGQAARAKAAGITIFTIGYAVGSGSAANCTNNSGSSESGINARSTLQQMASATDHYYEQPEPGSVVQIFQDIGHAIIVGGTRLVE